MADLGVMNENTRKLMSGDDSGDSSSIVEDKAINKMLDKRVRVKLGRILNDHGLFAPYDMLSDIRYKITLPTADDIMIHQSGQKVDGYTLDDIKLEYEIIEDADVAGNGRKIINTQSGVILEITKEGGDTLIDVYCSIYVVSDGMVNITNRALQSIVY